MVKLRLLGAAAAIAALSASIPAQAVSFVLTDTGGAARGTAARFGFEIATQYWSSVLKDNITVNLNIGFQALPTGVLGSTGSARTLLGMRQTYNALAADRTSALDKDAVASLPTLGTSLIETEAQGELGAITYTGNAFDTDGSGYIDTATRLDNDGGVNNSTVLSNKAAAKALGITTDVNGAAVTNSGPDGAITFSSEFTFDFNPTDGVASNAYDFIGVAIHEIGHALGFVSGVDAVDARTTKGPSAGLKGTAEDFVTFSQLDLFRYDKEGNLDWTTQSNPYFSIDGGETQLFGESRFSNGRFNGNTDPNGRGEQASHWRDSVPGVPQQGILDPTSGRGQLQEVTALDLAAYDAIGYDVGFDVLANPGYRFTTADAYRDFAATAPMPVVPEPSTWAQMLLGFGLLGGAVRYRRRKSSVSFA